MKVFSYKQIFFIPKLFICFLLFSAFLFTSCTRDKVIEKIIYGDTTTNENNNGNTNSNILSKEQFNSVAISREFNNIDDFYNYMKQCYEDKKSLLGTKFKVNAHFNLEDTLGYNNETHYNYKTINFYTSTSTRPYMYLHVSFVNTELNTNVTSIESLVFIVDTSYYYYDNKNFTIQGYSYL